MKQLIKFVLTAVIVLGILFAGIGFLLPEQRHTERSIIINASPEKVHEFVGDLQRWPEWSPWHESDRGLTVEVGPRNGGVGATQSWSGEDTSGDLIFTSDSPDDGIEYDISFHGGAYRAKGALVYKSDTPDATRISWTLTGDAGGDWGARYRGMFIAFMAGRRYQRALERLKAKVESETSS